MNHFTSRIRLPVLMVGLLSLASFGAAHAGDTNPGYDRPGLGFTPATLQAGDVTWEQGLPDFSHDHGSTLYSADSLLRVGLGSDYELQVGTSWNHFSAPGHALSGWGSTSAGIKFAPQTCGNFSWGLLGNVTFTDGSRAFGNRDRQYQAGAAFNWQLHSGDAVGAYLEADHVAGDNSALAAVNYGHNFSARLAGYLEAGWQWQDHFGNGSMAGAGVTYMATPNVQLDASFRHRLDGNADQWEGGVGVSVFFGHLL
ncbi:MAG TPA: transporter [Rhodanobacteraceae bacterium]